MNTFANSLKYSMLLLALPVLILPAIVSSAQAEASDSNGDYYKNEAPVQAPTRFTKQSAGSLWRVIVDELSCRQQPSLDSPVNRTYFADALLEVEVYRGGSDEVYVNPRDRKGKPWMPVRGANTEDVCYVRANNLYIQPVNIK